MTAGPGRERSRLSFRRRRWERAAGGGEGLDEGGLEHVGGVRLERLAGRRVGLTRSL